MKIAFKISVVSLGQLAYSLERIVVFMILSRTLTRIDYGTYQQVWLYYLTISPIFSMGLPNSLLYFIPFSKPEQEKTVVFQTLAILEAIGAIFCIITFFSAPLVASNFNNPALVRYLTIFAFYPLFALSPRVFSFLMISKDKPVVSAVSSVLFSLISIVLTTIPSIIGLPLIYAFYGSLAGSVIFFIGSLIFLFWYYKDQKFAWDWRLVRSQLFYSIPLGLSSIMGTLTKQLNNIIVSSHFTTELFAIYTNGAFEIPFISIITGSLMTVLIPEFTKMLHNNKTKQSVWKIWNDSTIKTAILLFPLTIFLLISAPDIMVAVFSSKYLESTGVFRIYLLITFVRITQYSSLLQAMGKTKVILFTSVLSLAINLLLSMILINTLDLYGPAWANVITIYSLALVNLLIIRRLLGIPFKLIMPWRQLSKIILISLFAGIGVLPIFYLLDINLIARLCIGGGIFLVIFISFLLLLKFVTIRDILNNYNLIKKEISKIKKNVKSFLKIKLMIS